jgi:Lanthionine synthetase C-like protein
MRQQQLLTIESAVTDIANELLGKRKLSPQGFCWENTKVETISLEVVQKFTPDLYNGNAGIVWFFTELYKIYPRPQYLETITGAVAHLMAEELKPTSGNYSFYTGKLGLVYLLLQIHTITNDESYIHKAVQIAVNSPSLAALRQEPRVIFDLLSGIAGAVLVLVHLYAVSNDKAVYDILQGYTVFLLENTRLSRQGFFWDQTENQILPVAGFSHGAGGIGYVLFQLGHYFKNDTLTWCGKQAYSYENSLYNHEMNNWPDYRQGITDDKGFERATAAYHNDRNYFLAPKEMTAWCHGAPGIGLARIGTAAFYNDNVLQTDIERALAKTVSDIHQFGFDAQREFLNYCLCHGFGGNALLLYEADQYKGQSQYEDLRFEIAMAAIAQKAQKGFYRSGYSMLKNQEAEGLLLGTAGIGCFLLSFLNSNNFNNILLPKLPPNVHNHRLAIPISTQQLLQYSFPLTLQCLRWLHLSDKWVDTIAAITAEGLIEQLSTLVQQSGHAPLQDVFTLELEKLRFSQTITSQSLLYISERKAKEAALAITDPLSLLQKKFSLTDRFKQIVTQWNWLLPIAATQQNLQQQPGSFQVLLHQTHTGVTAALLSDFSFEILAAFKERHVAKAVALTLMNDYGLETATEKVKFEALLAKQIKEFLFAGLLVEIEELQG